MWVAKQVIPGETDQFEQCDDTVLKLPAALPLYCLDGFCDDVLGQHPGVEGGCGVLEDH